MECRVVDIEISQYDEIQFRQMRQACEDIRTELHGAGLECLQVRELGEDLIFAPKMYVDEQLCAEASFPVAADPQVMLGN